MCCVTGACVVFIADPQMLWVRRRVTYIWREIELLFCLEGRGSENWLISSMQCIFGRTYIADIFFDQIVLVFNEKVCYQLKEKDFCWSVNVNTSDNVCRYASFTSLGISSNCNALWHVQSTPLDFARPKEQLSCIFFPWQSMRTMYASISTFQIQIPQRKRTVRFKAAVELKNTEKVNVASSRKNQNAR